MQIEVITGVDGLLSVREEWNQLWEHYPERTPFTSWDWAYYWALAYQDVARPVLLIAHDEGDIVGIAPLAEVRRGRFVILGSLEALPEYVGFLYAPDYRECALGTLLSFLAHSRSLGCRSLEVVHALANGALVAAFRDYVNADARICPAGQCWRIELKETLDATIAAQKKSLRRNLRRILRRNADLVTRTTADDLDFETAWRDFVTTHQARWNSVGEPGMFASRRMHEFHYHLAKEWCRQGRAAIIAVSDGNRTVATSYAFFDDAAAYAYNGGMLPWPEYRCRGIGIYSHLQECQLAIRRGLPVLDLLSGDEDYKTHWVVQRLPVVNIRVPGPGLSAAVEHRVVCGLQAMRSGLRDRSPSCVRHAVRWLRRQVRRVRDGASGALGGHRSNVGQGNVGRRPEVEAQPS